jgi:4'-phosphopantetheinyl transferase
MPSNVPALGPDDVHVWSASLPVSPETRDSCHDLLVPDERERADRMLVRPARELFVVGRGVLRALIGRYLFVPAAEVRFSYSAFGRPWVSAGDDGRPALQFSVSHSGTQIVLAVAWTARVGIDVERIRAEADCDGIAARFFAPAERAVLSSLAPADRIDAFFACWTRKEAVLKAVGLGITGGLSRLEVTCRPGDCARLLQSGLAEVDPARWSLVDLASPPGYRSALAVSLAEPHITRIDDAVSVVPPA